MNRHYKAIGIACLLLVAAFLAALALDSMLLAAAIALGAVVAFALVTISTMHPSPPARKHRPRKRGSRNTSAEPTYAVEAE